jgi:hypothetical protein
MEGIMRRYFLPILGIVCLSLPALWLVDLRGIAPFSVADHARPDLRAHLTLSPQEPAGCAWSAGAAGPSGRTRSRSGTPALDRALIAEVRKVDQVFQIRPGYRFLEDGARPNAYATDQTQVTGTWGTVLFGLTLIGQELQTHYGGAAVAGIAAHEGAHIFQFRNGYARRLAGLTVRRMELHADFLAGYYFARTGRTERSLVVFGRSLFSKGDYQFNDPNHHGRPEERVAAMQAGFAAGSYNLTDAAEEGVRYVMRN